MAFLWIGAWFIGITAVHWRDELNPHHELTFLHKAIASTLLFLVVARIGWRLSHPAPALPDTMSPLMKKGALIGHVLLYVVALLALPLSGWYWSSVADKPIMVAGLFVLRAGHTRCEGDIFECGKWLLHRGRDYKPCRLDSTARRHFDAKVVSTFTSA